MKSQVLVHLNLGSNGITNEGFEILFWSISYSKSLYSINFENVEIWNWNWLILTNPNSSDGDLGDSKYKVLNELKNMLDKCKTISILNLGDLSIGNMGIKAISQSSINSLLSLNLSKESITNIAVPFLHQILLQNTELKILKLSGNKFGDIFLEQFGKSAFHIQKLDISNNNITSLAFAKFLSSPLI